MRGLWRKRPGCPKAGHNRGISVCRTARPAISWRHPVPGIPAGTRRPPPAGYPDGRPPRLLRGWGERPPLRRFFPVAMHRRGARRIDVAPPTLGSSHAEHGQAVHRGGRPCLGGDDQRAGGWQPDTVTWPCRFLPGLATSGRAGFLSMGGGGGAAVVAGADGYPVGAGGGRDGTPASTTGTKSEAVQKSVHDT